MKSATRMYVLCALALLLMACTSFFLQLEVPRDGDITIHINAAQRILAGEKLYRDIITASFPMQFYLRIPGVLLAQWFGLNVFTVTDAFDHVVALAALVMVLLIVRQTTLASQPAVFPFLAVIIGCAMFVLPAYQRSMGEKEYFLWLFTLPYFVLAAARTENAIFSKPFRIGVGIFAALGFCYKPFFILPLLFVEAYLARRGRNPGTLARPEFLSCALTGAAYLLWMLFYFPEYRTVILPLGHFYYDTVLSDTDFLIRHYLQRLLPFAVATGLLWMYLRRSRPDFRPFLNVLCLAVLGFVLACVLQMKGYFSHLYPTLAMTITLFAFAAAFMGTQLLRQQAITAFISPAFRMGCSILFFALLALMALAWYTPPASPKTIISSEAVLNHAHAIHNHLHRNEPFTLYLLSAQLAPVFPHGIYEGVPWDYHFYHLWLLEGIVNFKQAAKHRSDAWIREHTAATETFLRETVTGDLERLKPAILLVNRKMPLDFINYFSQDPRFAELMMDYRFQQTVFDTDIYARIPGRE